MISYTWDYLEPTKSCRFIFLYHDAGSFATLMKHFRPMFKSFEKENFCEIANDSTNF